MEAKVKQLQKALEAQAREKNAENSLNHNAQQQQLPTCMSFNQANLNTFFNIRDKTEPQDQGEANTQWANDKNAFKHST